MKVTLPSHKLVINPPKSERYKFKVLNVVFDHLQSTINDNYMLKKLVQENNQIPEIRILVNTLEVDSLKNDKNILLKDKLDLKQFEELLNYNYDFIDNEDEDFQRPVKVSI